MVRLGSEFMIELKKCLKGKILDIGGGGEGIIGRLYTSQVVAIDNCQAELDEAPDCFEKVFMDARFMTFSDDIFDHVTFFYSLMFMSAKAQREGILEAARVVKPGGCIHIWDCDITCAYPEPFCVDILVKLPEEKIKTTYGVGKREPQSKSQMLELCLEAGFLLQEEQNHDCGFYLMLRKPSDCEYRE